MKNTLTGAIGKMRNAAGFLFVLAALFAQPFVSHAALLDEAPAKTVSPPAKNKEMETECPPGTFKFDGTCWVQGDCPEGEAVFRQGVCAPIPNWRYAPPVEEPTPPAEETKPEKKQ